MGNPLPESCAGLFIALCTGWILKKRTRKMICAHQSQQSESYTARLPFGSTKKNVKLRQKQFHMKDMGNPLPESCVMLFTTLCTGWILKKNTRNLIVAQKTSKNIKNWGNPDQSPLTPLRRALFAP